MIIYLHGFRSSPQSAKVRRLADEMAARGMADRLLCPALSNVPARAIAQVETLIAGCAVKPTLAGSSLGGYYATWLAERHDLKAALINPAVIAHLSLARYVGPQTNLYTGESFDFTLEHVEQLQAIEVPRITPSRYLLMVEKGDEVLDWRQAAERYAGCTQRVFEGGDHSFTRFAECIPQLLEFAGL